MGVNWGKFFPLLVISPSIARVLAKDGLKKSDVQQYLYDHSKVSVASMERLAWQGGFTGFSLRRMVEENLISPLYCESDDPGRMVPVFEAEWLVWVSEVLDESRRSCVKPRQEFITKGSNCRLERNPTGW
jgi:hypothetical protein